MRATSPAPYPAAIAGDGLELRPWDAGLVAQLAHWGERGFPYHAFDLGHLRNPARARAELTRAREAGPHRHFIACEGDTAVGRVSVNLQDRAGLYLWAVHVPPEHERRGVCRRMLAALLSWLEAEYPGPDFVLTTNTFAERAHHAYFVLGFEIGDTRWHYDRPLAEALWHAPREQRRAIEGHLRLRKGRWEVRTYLMVRPQRRPLPPTSRHAAPTAGRSPARPDR